MHTISLLQKQLKFSRLLARFINDLYNLGFGVTMGETWRSTATAKLMEDQKKGIASSLHCQRLAVDLNLFRDGHYLTDGKDYFDAGEIWESYSTDEFECAWGGRFGSKDYNHFSIAHAGIK